MIQLIINTNKLVEFLKLFNKIEGFYLKSIDDVKDNETRITFSSYRGEDTETLIFRLGCQLNKVD